MKCTEVQEIYSQEGKKNSMLSCTGQYDDGYKEKEPGKIRSVA